MIPPSLHRKLEALAERHEEVGRLLVEPSVLADTPRFRELSQEYAKLDPVAQQLTRYQRNERELADCRSMLDDPELGAIAAADAARLEAEQAELGEALQWLLIPSDPHDEANLYLELRAGAGGDEAAIFAGDLFRMYARYAEARRWQVEIMSEHPGEHGGYKEIIARIEGAGAYARLKYESGVHCVKRVPATEAQGRVHTSTATVAVLPELDEIDTIEIQPSELKIDTFRASGAGGQHVNKTDSAIRITHLPSGIVVECQDQRSQHKNRARALSLLQARLTDQAQSQQTAAQAQQRRLQVGRGDRSQRIRTYRYKDNLITDHRIGLESHRLSEVMLGDLDELIDGLLREDRAETLQALSSG